MRIRMKTTAAGPDGTFVAGREYKVDGKLAAEWLEAGYAEPVKAEAETATVEPDEAAVKPKPKRRSRKSE